MKIAFIGKFKKIYDEEGKALSLEKLGHKVIRFDENLFNRGFQAGWNNNDNFLLSYKPDVVMYTKLRIPNALEFVKRMKENNILTVSWFPDMCNVGRWENSAFNINWDTKDISQCPLANSDLVLLPDGLNQKDWRSLGINQYCVRQGIYHESCFVGDKIKDFDKDIIFIGTVNDGFYNYRKPLINFLTEKYGDKFLHLGSNNSDEVRDKQLNDVIKSSKIVVGDSIYVPYYWSNRIYETMGRGGFFLHPYVEGIDKEYEVGYHFDIYKNLDDLGTKIDSYLKDKKLRNKMAREGMKHTLKNHTLLNRSAQVMNIITNELESRSWFNGNV